MRLAHAIIVFLLLMTTSVFAADPAPLAMLKSTSAQMIGELNKHQAQLKDQPKIVNDIVNRILLPHVDLEGMSRAVVGRGYWIQATPKQRRQFETEFTQMVVNTYAAALQNYNGEQVRFFPIRGYDPDQSQVQVNSQILQANNQRINVQYLLTRKGTRWEVYDFSVDGISLVQSYHSQFSSVLADSGFTGLLSRVIAHNQAQQ